MKRIIGSSVMLLAVLAIIVGGTGAFFSDEEVSTGNVFTAGAIDLTVDQAEASYNGESCVNNCVASGNELIINGGFEDPVLNNPNYQMFPTGILGWSVESGAGIEVQRNAAGAPHSGAQHVELDSDNSTTMFQTLTTVAGQKYRLSFWHSPRPNRPNNDNVIGYEVQVVSGATTIIDGVVGVNNAGGNTTGNTVWTQYTYDFIATDTSTKIIFSDQGTVLSNTYGGYLDDVSVKTITCSVSTYADTQGGFCELWEATDLTTQKFFNFSDVKPQDSGTNLISLHVENNEAYMCLTVANQEDNENLTNDPELEAGDVLPAGELSEHLMVAGWYSDENGANLSPMFGPTYMNDLEDITFADSDSTEDPIEPGATKYVNLAWCLGTLTVTGNTFTCDGDVPNINRTQTDSLLADLQFYAVQTRNNEEFSCEAVEETPDL